MSAAGAALIDFDGAVQCRRATGAVNLLLLGQTGGDPVGALFAAADGAGLEGLPPVLHAVRLSESDGSAAGGPRRFRIEARELQLDFSAHSLQLHRDAAREFFRAVPPPRVPLGRRIGWTLLLTLLRVPGVEALLVRLRGSA